MSLLWIRHLFADLARSLAYMAEVMYIAGMFWEFWEFWALARKITRWLDSSGGVEIQTINLIMPKRN